MNTPDFLPPPGRLVRLGFPLTLENGFADAVFVRPLWESELSLNSDDNMANAEDVATATGLSVEAVLEMDQIDFDAILAAGSSAARAYEKKLQSEGIPIVR